MAIEVYIVADTKQQLCTFILINGLIRDSVSSVGHISNIGYIDCRMNSSYSIFCDFKVTFGSFIRGSVTWSCLKYH